MGRKSDARQRLMDAAYDLIWEHSYGAVTIDAICQRAGVKKGSFYYFFDSKSDLAMAALNMWWVERKALVAEMFQPDVPPLERIRKYLDYVSVNQIKDYENSGQVLGCPLFTLGSEISTQDEKIRSLINEILSTGARMFTAAIAEAQQTGEIEAGDAEIKGRWLWAFYEGTLTQARIDNDPLLLRTLTADAMELIHTRSSSALMAA